MLLTPRPNLQLCAGCPLVMYWDGARGQIYNKSDCIYPFTSAFLLEVTCITYSARKLKYGRVLAPNLNLQLFVRVVPMSYPGMDLGVQSAN